MVESVRVKMIEINRNCPSTPSIDDLKLPIFSPQDQSSLIRENKSDDVFHGTVLPLNLTDLQSPLSNVSWTEEIRRESFSNNFSSLKTMISQIQLKVAAAFLSETEFLQQREEKLEFQEKILAERQDKLRSIRREREQIEKDFSRIKSRLDSAVVEVTKFESEGVSIEDTSLLSNSFSLGFRARS